MAVPTFFANQLEFRAWLEKNYQTETELIVGFYKVNSAKPSMNWSESVDQALCFGWIDSVRRTVDNESYSIRFTPRKRTSIWSAINIEKVERLTKAGLMTAEGLQAFSLLKESKSGVYSYESETAILDSAFEAQFRQNVLAWDYFVKQTPSYKKAILHWIMSAKREETQISRLGKTIKECEQQKRI